MSLVLHRIKTDGAPLAPPHAIQRADDPQLMVSEATAPHLERYLYGAFSELRRAIDPRLVYAGMASGDLGPRLAPALDKFKAKLAGSKFFLANAHLQAHTIADHGLRGLIRKDAVQFDLDALPQSTQDALDGYDFGLIQQVTDDVRSTIGGVINRGTADGWSPAMMARSIQGSIGLTDTQAQAVENYRDQLANGSSGALDRLLRDQRSDGVVQAAVDGTQPLSPQQVDRLASGYEDRYVRYRANTIARYESLLAANQGASDAVQDAIDSGALDPSTVTSHWMINNDELTCPACRSIIDMQPDGVPYGTPFQWATAGKRGGRSGEIMVAPLHPSCRCSNNFSVGEP